MRFPAITLALVTALASCRPDGPRPLPPLPEAPPAPGVPSVPPPTEPLSLDPTTAERIRADVTWLASPDLAGRGTGEPGAKLAADFITKRFTSLGLVPMGDPGAAGAPRGWLQAFSARTGVDVERATVSVAPPGKTASAPLPASAADGSASGKVTGRALFVGHGITAPALHWDDYANANVEGAIVVVLDGAPRIDPDGAKGSPIVAKGAKDSAKDDAAKSPESARPDVLRDFGSAR